MMTTKRLICLNPGIIQKKNQRGLWNNTHFWQKNMGHKCVEVSIWGSCSYKLNTDQQNSPSRDSGKEKGRCSKTFPCSWSVVGVRQGLVHLNHINSCCLSDSLPFFSQKLCSKARSKSQTDIYITMIHSDNSVDLSQLFLRRGLNKIVALIRNTCSLLASVSISNIQTVTAVEQALILWQGSGLMWCKTQRRGLFLRALLPTQGPQ